MVVGIGAEEVIMEEDQLAHEPRNWGIYMTYAYMWLDVGPFLTEKEAIEAWKRLPERRGREVREYWIADDDELNRLFDKHS